jgi:holliday junction DNA helicase RuvA
MLGSLTGQVIANTGNRLLLSVHDVGYWVYTGSWAPSGTCTLYIHHHVREDASDLYGFADIPTLTLFEQLLTISGVGPKAALAVLSVGDASRVKEAIAHQDTAFLTQAPGIGQKAAQKIVLELTGKITFTETEGTGSVHSDVVAALTGLGYKEIDVRQRLKQLPADISNLDAQIKWVLQNM